MSKWNKFKKSPRLFVEDAFKKYVVRQVDRMSPEEQQRFGLFLSDNVGEFNNNFSSETRNEDLRLAEKLLYFERVFPVNGLQGGDADPDLLLWPYFRHLLWVRCQAAYKGKDASVVNTSKMYISNDWRKHYKLQYPVKTMEELKVGQCDFLFFTNVRGTEQTLIDGEIYNRITDPVFESAREIGDAKKVEIIKSIGDIWPRRVHDAELVLPPLLYKMGYGPITEKPKDFVSKVQKILPEARFDERSYNECVEWFFRQRDFYLDLLKIYNPKVVFFVGFDYHYALVYAAKSLGIKTVDLQHGVQAGWSPVYRHWQSIPLNGYNLLPDTFWVWGEYDAKKITETFGKKTGIDGNLALIGGFPWLDRQKDFANMVLPESLLKLKNQSGKNDSEIESSLSISGCPSISGLKPGYRIGLLTLQDQGTFPLLFAHIIAETTGRVVWIIKRHPKHKSIDLSSVSGNALYGQVFDDTSFLNLCDIADIHLTECSTAVIEADYFGIPSIVTGEQGMLNYKDFIDSGTVFYVDSIESFDEQIDSILAGKGMSRMGVVDNSGTKKALNELLNK